MWECKYSDPSTMLAKSQAFQQRWTYRQLIYSMVWWLPQKGYTAHFGITKMGLPTWDERAVHSLLADTEGKWDLTRQRQVEWEVGEGLFGLERSQFAKQRKEKAVYRISISSLWWESVGSGEFREVSRIQRSQRCACHIEISFYPDGDHSSENFLIITL